MPGRVFRLDFSYNPVLFPQQSYILLSCAPQSDELLFATTSIHRHNEVEMNDDHFPIGQRITLPGHFVQPVTLEAVRRIGSSYECRVRLSDGTPDEAIITADEASSLIGQRIEAAALIHPADAEEVRLLVESACIRLAYAHDRQFAVGLSGIRTLPHQIEAVC